MRGFATTSVASFAIAIGLMIAGALSPRGFAGNVDARWVAPVSGEWTDPARWSTNPFYPDNGTPAEADYRVLLDVPGPDYTVTLNAPTPVDVGSTLISSPAATLQHTGGTFTVGSLAVAAVGVGRYRITSGTLIVNQLSVGRALSFSFPLSGDGLFEQSGGWVNVIGAQTYVGHRAGSPAGTVTGTLNVSGPSRYSAVPPHRDSRFTTSAWGPEPRAPRGSAASPPSHSDVRRSVATGAPAR